jgi:hypothetical protein
MRASGKQLDKQKKGAFGRPFDFPLSLLLRFRHSALVASRGVLVDEAFARGAVEQFHRGQFFVSGSGGRPFEGCAERGFLGAVADGGGA